MRIWHYTVGERLWSILRDKIIKPATAGVPAGERPVVWFTTNPAWEPTANKGIWRNGELLWLTKEETAAEGGGLFRIEVAPDAAPYGWEEFKRLSGISGRTSKRLARIARQRGSNYHDWRVSFEPVTSDKWLRIETWYRDRWAEIPMDVLEAFPAAVDKGCGICGKQPDGAQWRPIRNPETGELYALCGACFERLSERMEGREED